MRLGFNLPHMGTAAAPDAIARVAKAAEDAGYEGLWTTDRLLFPVKPRTPYAGTPDGSLPEVYRRAFDPLDTLTYASAVTSKIGLGTSVLDMPFYNPALLARRLTSIDVLSGGRLRIGLGQGWSEDEFTAVGIDHRTRGARANELIRALHAIWKDEPAEFGGKYYNVPKSSFGLRPVQQPHPPVYFAAFSPAAMKRIAEYGDGWLPVGMPTAALKQMWDNILQMAGQAGRDTSTMEFIVRANVELKNEPLGEGRWPFMGSKDEIKQDVAAHKEIGAAEIHFDPSFDPEVRSVDDWLKRLEQIRELAG